MIHYLNNTDNKDSNIEDYFTINEIYVGNISHNKRKLEDLVNI